jgi:TolB-like protein/tetratricopeptide (TPR) repeat protein
MRYRFDRFELDAEQFVLREGGAELHVEPLVFDLLRFLVAGAGQVLTRDAIIEHVWKGRIVSDATVSSCIKSARRVLCDTGQRQTYIRTIRGRGFQFAVPVEIVHADADQQVSPREPQPEMNAAADHSNKLAPPTIAVLPLYPLTEDQSLALFGDALAQEIILELSRLHWLFVIARGSTFRFRSQVVDLAKAGAILGADYFLTGTIQKRTRQCVITVELCRAVDRGVMWAEHFISPLDEIMHLHSRLAADIVAALEPRIELAEALQAAKMPTERLDAWAVYHRALSHMYRFNKRDNELASELFARAVKLDPGFARAHAGLSFTHFQNAFLGFAADTAGEMRLTRAHAVKSMELDPVDPFVNLTMGRAEWLGGNLEASLPWIERSISLRPSYAFAIYNSALVGTLLGEGEINEAKVTKAISLSPIDPLNYAMLATRALTHVIRGNYETAANWGERAVRSPNAHVQIYAIAAFTCELAGNRSKAEEYIAHIRREHPGFGRSDFLKSFAFHDDQIRALVELSPQRLGL